ncbi:MAG TPA: BamA/TamA family outer membrane protein [Chitinophagaceae bacterium]|nr:BamA/TamA family outer membrane protein [Chitinophagaceae bacterium]
MIHNKAGTYKIPHYLFFFTALLFLFSACSIVKNYPANTPFVYETNIKVEGNLTADEKKQLTNQLEQQLHDSLQVRSVQKFIGIERGRPMLLYSVMNKPPVYDSLNVGKSQQFMSALLNSLGYFRDSITFNTDTNIYKDQYRTIVNFNVIPGKLVKLDSIRYNLNDSSWYVKNGDSLLIKLGNDTLQQIAVEASKESLLKKGEPFAKALISTEFNRMVDVYRNNGYLRFAFDNLVAVWDTVGLALLRPTLDPIEQATQIQELQKRRANPIADVEVRLSANPDTSYLTRFYVGEVTVYPDLHSDTGSYMPQRIDNNGYKIISYFDRFKPKVVVENIYLKRGNLYRQRDYLKTLNRFNSLAAWHLASIDQTPRPGTDTVDFVIKLTPADKYLFDFNVEGSRNWGNPFTTGDLLGLGINLGLQNRNFARGANQSNTNLRYGVELNSQGDFLQTQQASLSHNIYFPRHILQFPGILKKWREDPITRLSMNVGNTDRKNFFNLTTFNASWGYEFKQRNKLLSIRLPNVEYTFLNRRDSLDALIKRFPSYEYIFNKGLIISSIANFSITSTNGNIKTLKRVNLEGSGFLAGFIKNNDFLDSNLYRFLKLDAEFRQARRNRTGKKEFAWRAFAGVGYEFASNHLRYDRYMPFFRQYYGGGPNSMRAWGLRRLGPGSTMLSSKEVPDRFGDIQLEANAEYRFFLADLNGVKINSALFTDVGNVWFLRKNENFPGGEFRPSKLWNDLGIGLGTGLRIDFGFFLVRVDYAYKVKDPSPDNSASQNKWFYDWKPLDGQLQLGVNYPF